VRIIVCRRWPGNGDDYNKETHLKTCSTFLEQTKKSFADLSFTMTEIDPALKHIEVEGGRSTLEVFQGEKVAKAIFSAIEIDSMSVCEQSVIIWPQNHYDLPIFWCNLTQMPGMSFHIFDLIPLMDIVVWPAYGEKYLTRLQAIKQKAVDVLGDGIIEKNFDITTVVGWAFSPNRILFKLTETGVTRLAPLLDDYGTLYKNLYNDASQATSSAERDFAMRKREAVRRLMKENDPGYPLMTGLFGNELTAKVFDIVF
jgi:hypothetical protein